MVSSQTIEVDSPIQITMLGRLVQTEDHEPVVPVREILPQYHTGPAILLVDKGCGCLSVAGLSLACAPNDIFYINPGELYSGSFEPGFLIYRILFRYEILETKLADRAYDQIIRELITGEKKLPLSIRPVNPIHPLVHQEVRRLIEISPKKNPGASFFMRAALYTLIGFLIEDENTFSGSAYSIKPHGIQGQRLTDVLTFLQAHYTEKIRLEQMAEIAHLNKSYFSEYFKASIRYTPVDYLNLLRINKAKELLETTDRKIEDIAFETGFNSYNYFSRVFKALCNMTPSDYRKSMLNCRNGASVT
jgi:AraC-like DNA-binding protein